MTTQNLKHLAGQLRDAITQQSWAVVAAVASELEGDADAAKPHKSQSKGTAHNARHA